MDLTKEEQILALRKKYDSLSKGTQQKIPEEVKNILTEAEETLKQLHWKAAADQMIEQIKGIGAVDFTKEDKISEIRRKYNQLSEDIKKKITIKSKKLKSVGKNAIKDIDKKAYIDVPKSKVKTYKKLFKSKTGYKKSMKLK